MEWKTRITEIFGCKYPIVQGAFRGFGTWQLAAAVAEAGALGMITAGTSRTPEKLREDIKRCRDATDKAFAVNLSFTHNMPIEEMLEVCIKEGVPVETSTYKPDSLAPRIKESGLKWINKSARVKDAIHAEKLGTDAIIVVGLEGAGFKNPEQLPTMITTISAIRQLKVPFIAAGGIGDAHGFLGALGMGAEGIMMGTALMATKECPISDAAKEAMVQENPENPQVRNRVLASPDPKDLEEVMKLRDKMPLNEWLQKVETANVQRSSAKDSAGSASQQEGESRSTAGSLAVGVIDHVLTVKELIDSIIHGAEELLDSRQFLKTK